MKANIAKVVVVACVIPCLIAYAIGWTLTNATDGFMNWLLEIAER